MISFQNISKSFGLNTLYEGLNLTIQGGDFACIVGPSGVGKSTLIHMLIGAERPDAGEVVIDGYDVARLKSDDLQLLRRSMGIIFQDFKLLRKKTVFENIAFAMEACGESDDAIAERVPEVLRKVGLEKMIHKFADQLSGGEKQRVAIARALVHQPSLLIADEPTGNLDPHNAREIGELLMKLNKEDKITIILATHDKDLVEHLQPRVILLKNGVIVSDVPKGGFWE